MAISVKDALHNQLEDVYNKQGYKVLMTKCWKLMEFSENNAGQQKYRNVKGELAEIVLEYSLWELQKIVDYPTVVLKSLCIPFRTGNCVTTEMDLVFITPYKIYMFECKSYKNRPTLTDKCLLDGKMDIYKQQELHTTALHQYINGCIDRSHPELKPYKCIFYEMSIDGVEDKRSEAYKKLMPVISPREFFKFMCDEMKKNAATHPIIDVKKTVDILTDLDANSKKMFEKHLQRLTGKNLRIK